MSRRGRTFRLPWRTTRQIESEVDEEIRFHLEARVAELVAGGMGAEAASERAVSEFGDVAEAEARLRHADTEIERRRRWSELLGEVLHDVRLAVRSLVRSPVPTLSAVAALALGIGATATVFSVVNWVLLRPIAGVVEPEGLVLVQFRDIADPNDGTGISYVNLRDLQKGVPAFESLAGYSGMSLQVAAEGAPPTVARGEAVAGDYFGVLGLRPAAGRLLTREETGAAYPGRLAVISARWWRGWFGGEPDVIGRKLTLNGLRFTIVGVAPEGFRGTERLGEVDVWVPVSAYPELRHSTGLSLSDRRPGVLQELVGRLRPGAMPGAAQEQLRRAMATLVESHPEDNEIYAAYQPTVFPGIGLDVRDRGRTERTLRLMMGVVLVVLLIACANVSNLLLFRGMRRRGETAVRRALGASGGRLLRGYVLEGLLISLSGAFLGVVIALGAVRLFRGQRLVGLPLMSEIALDWRVIGFALLLALLTGIFFGLVPAVALRAEDFLVHLKDAARTATGRSRRLRGALTVAQISAALVLLVGALLLARTLHNLSRVELGFDAENVFVFEVDPGNQGYTHEENTSLRRRILDSVSRLPGVGSAAISSGPPFGGSYYLLRLKQSSSSEAEIEGWEFSVSAGYLPSVGIPVVAGRGFSEQEPSGSVIVSAALARRLFGVADPVGREIVQQGYEQQTVHTIIGVTGDTRIRDLRGEPDRVIYRPISEIEEWRSETTILVRSRLSRAELEPRVQEAVSALDPSLAFYRVQTLPEGIVDTIAEERLLARIIYLVALLAVLLSAVGLYAVISYSVAQRTREIGIRIALGAGLPAVIRLVAAEAGGLAIAGVVLGTAAGAMLARLLESRLFGVQPLDPVAFTGAVIVVIVAVIAAGALPARSAARIDPVDALRAE